jgi:rRNA maturation endonuclease Nob1
MACKGLCSRYKAKWAVREFRYASGQKRCNRCEIYLQWDGLWCPCCGISLRIRPRTSKYRTVFFSKTNKIEKIAG